MVLILINILHCACKVSCPLATVFVGFELLSRLGGGLGGSNGYRANLSQAEAGVELSFAIEQAVSSSVKL